jgi:hypothetical protein
MTANEKPCPFTLQCTEHMHLPLRTVVSQGLERRGVRVQKMEPSEHNLARDFVQALYQFAFSDWNRGRSLLKYMVADIKVSIQFPLLGVDDQFLPEASVLWATVLVLGIKDSTMQ